jgi:hypothetical protein
MYKLKYWIHIENIDFEGFEKNKDKIIWSRLSLNPKAIHLLEQNQEKINWDNLSENPKAIHLLEQNPDKINWYELLANPSIFELD